MARASRAFRFGKAGAALAKGESLTEGKTRTPRGSARLETLTENAADLFLELGYEAVSLDAVIARAGGSRRNIYEQFGGKEGLFIQAIAKMCAEELKPLASLEIPDDDEKAALTVFGALLLEAALQPRTLALHRLMIAEGARFPQLAQAIHRAGHEECAAILSRWISARQREGRFRADLSAHDLAEQFVVLLVAVPQLHALHGMTSGPLTADDISRLTKLAVETFLSGALARGEVG